MKRLISCKICKSKISTTDPDRVLCTDNRCEILDNFFTSHYTDKLAECRSPYECFSCGKYIKGGKHWYFNKNNRVFCSTKCHHICKIFELLVQITRYCRNCGVVCNRAFCNKSCKQRFEYSKVKENIIKDSNTKEKKKNPNRLPYHVLNDIEEKRRLQGWFY